MAAPKNLAPTDVRLLEIAQRFGDSTVGLIHAFAMLASILRKEAELTLGGAEFEIAIKLAEYGLTQRVTSDRFALTELGHRFLLRLQIERDVPEA